MQAWRSTKFFDDVFKLVGVPVITVQLRYDGWVTEMQVRGAGWVVAAGGGAAGSWEVLRMCCWVLFGVVVCGQHLRDADDQLPASRPKQTTIQQPFATDSIILALHPLLPALHRTPPG